MPKIYTDLEAEILQSISIETARLQSIASGQYGVRLGKAAPMRQVISRLRSGYTGMKPPDKTTVWRAIKRLQAEGKLLVEAKEVVRVFKTFWLSIPEAAIMDFDTEFSPQRRGEKLFLTMRAREAVTNLIEASGFEAPSLNPIEALSRRSQGELAALAATASTSFSQLFTPLGMRSYALKK